MTIDYISYDKVPHIGTKDLAYITEKPFLNAFYSYLPRLDNFEQVITDREKYNIDRLSLHHVLEKQYANLVPSEAQKKNISSIIETNSFTVATAHQPSLLGGPLYYIYKICSTIHLAQQLNKKYPKYNIIPIFINGSEDHDFEEINHLNMYNHTITWDNTFGGAIGRLPISGVDSVISQAEQLLARNKFSKDILDIFQKSYAQSTSYGEFVARWLNKLFAKYGLLILNMDEPLLKQNFTPILEEELFSRPSKNIINSTQSELKNYGWKAQAYAREINMFYLSDASRDRIEFKDNRFWLVDKNRSYTKSEFKKILRQSPGNFSPNVVMRPLYQEFTLPNLAYIGGGGELAYWLERKSHFSHFGIFYPMLIRRNSVMLYNTNQENKLTKMGLSMNDIFENEHELVSSYLQKSSELDFSLDKEKQSLDDIYQSIVRKTIRTDPGLERFVLASLAKQQKELGTISKKLKKSLKQLEETNIKKIRSIQQKLFPKNMLQERFENFLPYITNKGPLWLEFLIENLNPMDKNLKMINVDSI